MIRIALRMIFGARGRYATLILGLAFAVLLSTQQVAILLSVLRRATGPLQNVGIADLWVVSRDTLSIDYLRNMHDRQLMRVRSCRELSVPSHSSPSGASPISRMGLIST
jgi:putative ABC transport system permease protein